MNILSDCHAAFINLDSRMDRLLRMKTSLAKAGIQAERVRGILPSEYKGDPKKVQGMLVGLGTHRGTPGALGCHLSQTNVMETALHANKHAFVMEDDLVFCSDIQKRFELMGEFTQNRAWDVLWLGGTFHVNPPWWHTPSQKMPHMTPELGRDAETTDNPRFMRTYGAFSTHAYIVNRESIAKILALLDAGLHYSIGIDYLFITLEPQLQTFAFVPGCIKQYDNQSNIGKGVTKFSGFAKLGLYWWADKLEDFCPETFDWAETWVVKQTANPMLMR